MSDNNDLQKRSSKRVLLLIITSCAIMALIDAALSPEYFIKSAIKLVLFLILPIIILRKQKDITLKDLLKMKRKMMLLPILLGIGVYLLILGAYYIIGPYFDFTNVTVALADNYGVKKENFVPVALYISFANSLLEEFFFRGLAFLTLKKLTTRRFAYLFSSVAFSLYHIAIMSSWFNPFLVLLLIVSLFIAGLLFNWLNEKSNTIYTSWLVHMCANFATNTIGFILFGII
ncbi:MAG: Abortive infection protein [Herbinix sp.]|jgi:membrane protease YdiL (CAAX protease family)|nr:Abortive infection protein [Herbinix sp.]